MILAIKTDNPIAELYAIDDVAVIASETWEAHRLLADTIHSKIKQLLESVNATEAECKGVIVFKGPGSFTGLRIGITVANTMAFALGVAIVGANGQAWITDGASKLASGANDVVVTPEYGADAHISVAKK